MTAKDGFQPAATLNVYEVHAVLEWFHRHTEQLAALGAVPTGQDSALAARLKAVSA